MNPTKEMMKAQERERYRQYQESFSTIVQMFGPLNFNNFFQYSMFSEAEDYNLFTRNLSKLVKHFIPCCIAGILLNRQITKIDMVAKSPLFVRIPVRMALFFAPNLVFMPTYMKIRSDSQRIWAKYDRRINNYLLTGKFSYLDPEGLVYQRMLKDTQEFEANKTG